MQFDRTQITIRERGPLETLDVALHVLRRYFLPLLATMAIGVVPLMAWNHWLIGWMADVEYGDFMTEEDVGSVWRYVYNMSLLVLIEAQLASVFATRYIGQAVFLERPRIKDVVRSVLKSTGALAWWQMTVRGPLLAWLALLMVERRSEFTAWEGLALPTVALWSIFLRALWPFVTEIIVLEGNPMFRKTPATITIWRRGGMLHGPASGDLMARWFGSAVVGVPLALATYSLFVFMSGVFLNDWQPGPILIKLALPVSLWLVAMFMTVYRFLSYLDLRIRMEGWEVELRLRAEGARLGAPFLGDAA